MATQMAEWVIKFDDKGTPVLEKIQSELRQVDHAVDRTEKSSRGMLQTLESFGVGFALYQGFHALKDGVMALGQEVIQNTAEFEKYRAVLANTYGSSLAAGQAMGMLSDFAAKTPFQLNQLTAAYVKLANRGINPTEAALTSLGDFAASTGKDFDQLTEAILDGSNPERWKEFGVKVSRENGMVTLSYKGMTETVKDNANAVEGVIEKWGKVPGIAGNMAAQSKTLGGRISNLSDNWDQLTIAIGQSQEGLLAWGVEGLGSAIDWMKKMVSPMGANEKSWMDEAHHLREVRQALLDVQTPEEKRLALLKELKDTYPGLIGNIKEEAQQIGNVAAALDRQIALTIKKAYVAKREKDIGEMVDNAATLEAQKQEIQQQIITSLGEPAMRPLEKQFSDSNNRVDYDKMMRSLASESAYRNAAYEKAGLNKQSMMFVDGQTMDVNARSKNSIEENLSRYAKLGSKLSQAEKLIEGSNENLSQYMRRFGIGQDDMKFKPKGGPGAGNLDPGGITTSITSAAPKILNVNIDTVHRGNNTIVVKREDIGRQVREEIKRANLEGLADSTILAGWNGE